MITVGLGAVRILILAVEDLGAILEFVHEVVGIRASGLRGSRLLGLRVACFRVL